LPHAYRGRRRSRSRNRSAPKLAKEHHHLSTACRHDVKPGEAVSYIGIQPGFAGLNLNIAASTRPLQTAQPVAAFVLRAT
jgi:hypothetical protein